MVLFTFQYLFWGQELEHSVFLFTCSSLEISSENRVISYIVRKVWMRRLQCHWNRRKRFSNDGVIPRTSLSRWILRGDWLWKSIRAFWRVGIATYGCLGCCHRLCQKGDGSFHWKLVWRSQESGSILGSFVFSPYLFFHTSNFGQVWYLRKAIIEDYLTLLMARRSE